MAKVKTGIGWPHDVTRSDLEISFYKGSGAGGQKKNKTSSGVRLKHLPTGHVVQCDEHREQSKNKLAAFKKLADLLIPIMKNESVRARHSAPDVRVRTYKEKDNLVIDERIEDQVFSYEQILDGDLDGIVDLLIIKDTLKATGQE